MKVPMGKTIYLNKRKYVGGDELPPHVYFELPEMTKEQADDMIQDEYGKFKNTNRT